MYIRFRRRPERRVRAMDARVGVLENPSLSQVQRAIINIHPILGHLAQLTLSGDWTSEHEENILTLGR